MYETYERIDRISDNVVQNATIEFVDMVREKGYISPVMYNDFIGKILKTHNTYYVEIIHKKDVTNPVYTDAADPSTFQSAYRSDFLNYYTDSITAVLFPNNNTPINDDTRVYYMTKGDYIEVTVQNTNITQAQVFKNALNITGDTSSHVYYHYGGLVRNTGG